MESSENIIAIRNRDIREANKAFAEFMNLTERYMNDFSSNHPSHYCNCSSERLEREVLEALKTTCPSTPFRQEDIKLVSGSKFPDILASKYYGVEVKSTKTKNWTSTGSSIVENTRIEDVERIYILFGRLGNNPASFKCKLYQECLSEIAVTHSPRYLIDMELPEKEDILSKMGTEYDIFRKLEEGEKIEQVRRYYLNKAKKEKKTSIPWWMKGTAPISLSFYAEQSEHLKNELKCRAFILFPDLLGNSTQVVFKKIALWLCNRYSLLNPSLRDMFSAGGRRDIKIKTGEHIQCSALVKRLIDSKENIQKLLEDPDADLLDDIEEYWDFNYDKDNLFVSWLKIVDDMFKSNLGLKNVSVYDIF